MSALANIIVDAAVIGTNLIAFSGYSLDQDKRALATRSSREQELYLKTKRPTRCEAPMGDVVEGLQRRVHRLIANLEDFAHAAADWDAPALP